MSLLLLRCKQAHLGQLDLHIGDFPAPITTLGSAVDSRILHIRRSWWGTNVATEKNICIMFAFQVSETIRCPWTNQPVDMFSILPYYLTASSFTVVLGKILHQFVNVMNEYKWTILSVCMYIYINIHQYIYIYIIHIYDSISFIYISYICHLHIPWSGLETFHQALCVACLDRLMAEVATLKWATGFPEGRFQNPEMTTGRDIQ